MSDVIQRAVLILTTLSFPSLALPGETNVLPQGLEAMIADKISAVSAEEKDMIASWPPGKKLSEFFCQEPALRELGKTYTGADRVFLSMSDDEPPQFVAENRIKGYGSVRHDAGWTDITYECEVDMESGRATKFIFDVRP